jgi:uncharacterized membrane protein (DUF4010 family)
MNEYELDLANFVLFAQSLGIGFLIGLERERHPEKIAGVRTFTGLTDVDAITVANLKLFSAASISEGAAVNAVIIAFMANLIFKLGIVLTTADRRLRLPVITGFSILLIGVALGRFLAFT